jgi:limonene-1,2-epoxide hydrolase
MAPGQTIEAYLQALVVEDVARASTLLTDDVVWSIQALPPVMGCRAVERILHLLDRPSVGFDAYVHSITSDGSTVWTERTDIHRFGRWRSGSPTGSPRTAGSLS